jgi:ATP-dependent Clp protease adaptor protein ClpS
MLGTAPMTGVLAIMRGEAFRAAVSELPGYAVETGLTGPSEAAGFRDNVAMLQRACCQPSCTPKPSGGLPRLVPRRRTYDSLPSMSGNDTKPVIKDEIKVERPRLHKVILINDDYTPREFVVTVLKAEFRISEDQANRVMITAHRRGACLVAVYTKEVAESKATNATDAGRSKGYPLLFTTEPEE